MLDSRGCPTSVLAILFVGFCVAGFRRSTSSSITTMAVRKITLTQLVLCALLGVIGINGKPPSAIVGGDLAADNEFPYLVSLSVFGEHICGGTIIDSLHILTAAHCVDGPHFQISNLMIIGGTNYLDGDMGEVFFSKNVTIHPNFSTNVDVASQHDIAVITLSSAIEFDRRQRPAKLPTSDTPVETPVIACGWGSAYYPGGSMSSSLRKLSMVVIPNNECRPPEYTYIRKTHICAHLRKGAGLCVGDSGGPLLNNGTLVGISSFSVLCGVGSPDVFTRVHSYVDWINEVIKMY